MADWIITRPERTVGQWILASTGAVIVSGSAWARYWRQNGTDKEWLQSDGTSWSTTLYEFPLTVNPGEGFFQVLTVPASALNYIVTEEVRHSNPLYPVLSDEHFVTDFTSSSDPAAIAAAVWDYLLASATVHGSFGAAINDLLAHSFMSSGPLEAEITLSPTLEAVVSTDEELSAEIVAPSEIQAEIISE